jgi:hypothetical protein
VQLCGSALLCALIALNGSGTQNHLEREEFMVEVIITFPLDDSVIRDVIRKRVASRNSTIQSLSEAVKSNRSKALYTVFQGTIKPSSVSRFENSLKKLKSDYNYKPIDRLVRRLPFWIEAEEFDKTWRHLTVGQLSEYGSTVIGADLLHWLRPAYKAAKAGQDSIAFSIMADMANNGSFPIPDEINVVESDEWLDVEVVTK